MAKRKVKTKAVAKKKAKKKTSKKVQHRSNLIGVDPLAWLDTNEEQEEVPVIENQTMEEEISEQILMKQTEILSDTTPEPEEASATSVNNDFDIDLGTSLTIRNISDVMEELNKIDEAKQELVFESEQLEKVDTAALQLLLGFYLHVTNTGKKVIWHKPSEAFYHAAELLGIHEILNISSVST